MTIINRIYTRFIKESLKKKLVLVSGPRQTGKTYLSKKLIAKNYEYLNFDVEDHRTIIKEKSWPRQRDYIIFDELHKLDKWKQWLKGVYDSEGIEPNILVTGSARMDVFKKGGDSLAGRHRSVRMYPFSLKEVSEIPDNKVLERMISFGNFPEPFLEDNLIEAKLWRKSHLERIIKEDLLDLGNIRQLKKLEILVQLLSERVGSLISYSSLARDLEVSPNTIKDWIVVLEDLYIVFSIRPYTKNISKSILKSPKIYFYDTARVRGDEGSKIENLVAFHLLKRNHFLEDTQGEKYQLFYIKDTRGREVDFLTTHEYEPEYLIEVKTSDEKLSKPLKYFSEHIKPKQSTQVVFNLTKGKQYNEITIQSIAKFLFSLGV